MGRVVRWSLRVHWTSIGLALCLCGAPAISRAEDDARSEQRPPDPSFRLRAKLAMQAALGRPVETRNDAVQAAYLAADASGQRASALRSLASSHAASWGFDLSEFTRTDSMRFSLEDLADAPLPAADVHERPRQKRRAARTRLELPQLTVQVDSQQGAPPEPRTAAPNTTAKELEAERRVTELSEALMHIVADIDALEARLAAAKSSKGAHPSDQLILAEALQQLLERAERSARDVELELARARSALASR